MSKFEKIPDIDELNNFNNYLKKKFFFCLYAQFIHKNRQGSNLINQTLSTRHNVPFSVEKNHCLQPKFRTVKPNDPIMLIKNDKNTTHNLIAILATQIWLI